MKSKTKHVVPQTVRDRASALRHVKNPGEFKLIF